MFNYHPNCIFCHSNLPEIRIGVGEHVIPKSIYGFWRIYDVCNDCMLHFGDKVDSLAAQHPWIIGAMKELSLPRADKMLENLPYVAEDTMSGRKLPVTKKGKSFKLKLNFDQDEFFECSETDWLRIGVDRIRRNARPDLSEEERECEIERIKDEYAKLRPGESVFSELLEIQIRKAQFTNVAVDRGNFPSITPLIAKIAVSFLSYVLSEQQIQSLSEFDELRRHARFGEPLRPYLVNWCPLLMKESYRRCHRIRAEVLEKSLIADISLFAYPSWRIILRCNTPFVLYDLENKLCSGISLILDFDNIGERTKLFGFKRANSSEYEYHQFDI